MMSPCKGCEDRVIGCHSTCKRYGEYRAVCDANIQQRKERIILTHNPRIGKALMEKVRREKNGRQ